jgi:glucan phosphoethanolaminetransferase (alkaline phosphatase superfamily)
MPHRLFRLLTVVWVGSLLTIGYATVPVLFASLDRMTAGSVAAQLFRIEGIIGVVCGVLLLALCNVLVRRGEDAYRKVRWLVAGMLLCVLLGYFAVEPFMNALRVAAQDAGTDVSHSVYASRFGMLHGVSSLFYLIESLLALVLVWKLPVGAVAPAGPHAGSAAGRAKTAG